MSHFSININEKNNANVDSKTIIYPLKCLDIFQNSVLTLCDNGQEEIGPTH